MFIVPPLLIWGVVLTFGSPDARSPFGPGVILLAIAALTGLITWSRRHDGRYGYEKAVDGGEEPRWYLRVAILVAYLCFEFIFLMTLSWVALLPLIPFAIAAASIYRRDRLRGVRWPWPFRSATTTRNV